MKHRKRQAFRPGTTTNHRTQISLFISFCIHFKLDYVSPDSHTLCLYAEWLSRTFKAPRAIRIYISGVNTLHKYIGAPCDALHSFELDLMLRALDLSMYHIPNKRLPVNRDMLHKICHACNYIKPLGATLKVAFLFGYYGFLRQSNLAPHEANSLDSARHTCRGDILLQPPGIVVILKWTKTIQRGENVPLIPIPRIPGSLICPYQAYMDMLRVSPTRHSNDPLLAMPGKHGKPPTPLTCSHLRRAFCAIVSALGYPPRSYSLHSLRAGGATDAYNAGVDYLHVKRHGTWTSDSFWSYIANNAVEHSPVANALSQ